MPQKPVTILYLAPGSTLGAELLEQNLQKRFGPLTTLEARNLYDFKNTTLSLQDDIKRINPHPQLIIYRVETIQDAQALVRMKNDQIIPPDTGILASYFVDGGRIPNPNIKEHLNEAKIPVSHHHWLSVPFIEDVEKALEPYFSSKEGNHPPSPERNGF